ncbi:hypothetical protein [Nocardia beijingensis]
MVLFIAAEYTSISDCRPDSNRVSTMREPSAAATDRGGSARTGCAPISAQDKVMTAASAAPVRCEYPGMSISWPRVGGLEFAVNSIEWTDRRIFRRFCVPYQFASAAICRISQIERAAIAVAARRNLASSAWRPVDRAALLAEPLGAHVYWRYRC